MISVRRAQLADCHFLASVILIAEDTGFEITAYTKMFNKSNEELLPVFEKIINNETEGHPLTYRSYLIATANSIPAAALAVYSEGEHGDSNHLTTGALMTGFDRKSMVTAFSFLKDHTELGITKGINTLQIDCVATLPEYRGKGLLKELIKEAEKVAMQKKVSEMQIQVWKMNDNAIKAYQKLGFVIVDERLSKDDDKNGKILMVKKIM